MKKDISIEIEIPNDVSIEISDKSVTVKFQDNEIKRTFLNQNIEIKKEDNKIILFSKNATKREKADIGTIKAHISNMIKGVTKVFEYKLKICSSHFPMTVNVEGDKVIIKNFLGEKIPRKSRILGDVKVSVEGDEISVKGCNIEDVGQTAANIELSCKVKKRDRRVFQDGCYIIKKAKGEVA